jgi:hypothetical protein
VETETALAIVFAGGAIVAVALLLWTLLGRPSRTVLLVGTALEAVLAAGAWTVFALDPQESLAVSAGGLTACMVLAAATLPVRRALVRGRRVEEELRQAERTLHELVEREVAARSAELERLLARARADSVSLLAEEERRLAESRRREFLEREKQAGAGLAETLAAAQQRIDRRLADWAQDLDRAQQHLTAQHARIGERQQQLIAQAENRLAADVERLEAGTEDQRAVIARAREELAKAADQTVADANAELEGHAAERRRALHELSDRLRRRERELLERIGREEADAAQRIQLAFADIERRSLDQLSRAADRAWRAHADAASQQFEGTLKGAREDAARRLARELDRAVESFTREAQGVLAERLSEVAEAGTQRLEKRLNQLAAGVERQREDVVTSLEARLADAEGELRRQLQSLMAETDAERAVLRARLDDLSRRLDEVVSRARERLAR